MFNQLALFRSSGHLELSLGADARIKIDLSESEADLLRAMCERFYGERQMALAEQVAKPIPALAHFTENPDE